MVKVNDSAFGEMTYNHRWVKGETIKFFGKEWELKIVAKAFSGKPISDMQRNAYLWFKENILFIDEKMYHVAAKYINDNCYQLASYWVGARMVNSTSDLKQILVPRSVLFKQDGSIAVLLDCPWDEHGLAIQVKPTLEIGPQDMYI